MRLWTKPLRLILCGLVMLSLTMSLTSCVTLPAPPAQYLKDCEVTYLSANPATNADVSRLALSREYDVRLCNADKRALRAYYEGYTKACGLLCRKSKD